MAEKVNARDPPYLSLLNIALTRSATSAIINRTCNRAKPSCLPRTSYKSPQSLRPFPHFHQSTNQHCSKNQNSNPLHEDVGWRGAGEFGKDLCNGPVSCPCQFKGTLCPTRNRRICLKSHQALNPSLLRQRTYESRN